MSLKENHGPHQETTNTSLDLDAMKSQALPEHWSLFLHCTICFGFFNNPHTLECGHSFCKRCLKKLAEIAREDNPDVRLRRLSLNCPACRHPFPAKSALKGRIRTCIVLKKMVELWKRECKLLLSSPSKYHRSICSQTESSGGRKKSPSRQKTDPSTNLQEEFSTKIPPADEYLEALMRHVSESFEEIEQDQPEDTGTKANALQSEADPDRRHQSSSDSESSMSSSGDDAGGRGNTGDARTAAGIRRSSSNVSIPDIFGRLSISRIALHSSGNFPLARFLLIGVWFIYSLLIVALAESFLPYIILFTLFFFLIVLK